MGFHKKDLSNGWILQSFTDIKGIVSLKKCFETEISSDYDVMRFSKLRKAIKTIVPKDSLIIIEHPESMKLIDRWEKSYVTVEIILRSDFDWRECNKAKRDGDEYPPLNELIKLKEQIDGIVRETL